MNAGPGKLDARAKELFAAALERPEAERTAFLEQACSGDAGLRRQVETLLRNLGDAQERFEESPPAPGEQPGDTIGHYKLRQKIGEGGFGVVWMAEQEQPVRRMVALKVLKPGMDTAQVIGRFEAERQALALMDHPNIAKVFDGGATPSGRPYFVMELVKGVPITKYCDDAGLSMEERLGLFVPVCQAVQHAHQKGVIHRDIKPSNVLVTLHDGTPTPKVIDFGIAKAARGALTQRTVFTEFRQMIGTPEYMAPEQADLSALDVDTRADVYSLGVVLYELLTGTRPFELRTLLNAGYAEMLRTIREVDPPKPSTRVSTLGDQVSEIARHRRTAVRSLGSLLRGDLDWIVMKALEKERSRRYETASALAEDVQRHLRNEPVLASPPSRVYRLRKYVRRHRIGAIATCSVAVSLVFGAVAAGLGYVEARDQAELARKAEKRADAERAAAVESAAEAQRQKEAAQAAEREAREQAERAEMESTLADTEANRAESVVTLLTTMLASGDPHVTRDKDYPVRSVLEDFERGLGDTLKEQPEVEATMRRVLGRAYLGLGLPEKAEPHLLRATELCRGVYGGRHDLVALSMADEAELRHSQGRFEDAVRILQHAQQALPEDALQPRQDPAAGPHTSFAREVELLRIRLLEYLGDNLRHLGDMDGAESAGRAALALAVQQEGESSPVATECGGALAILLLDAGRPGDAEPFLRTQLEQSSGEADPNYSALLSNLGQSLKMQGRSADAEPLLRQALEREERLLGEESPEIWVYLHNLAHCELELRKLPDAERFQRRALALVRQCRPADHNDVESAVALLNMILGVREDQAAREQLWRDRVAELSADAGDDSAALARARVMLGASLIDTKKFVEAEEQVRRSQETLLRIQGAGRDVAISWVQMARVHLARESWDEAARCLDLALGILGPKPERGEEIWLLLAALAEGRFLRGEMSAAIDVQRRAVARLQQCQPEPLSLAQQQQRLSTYLHAGGQTEAAELLLRPAVGVIRSALPPGDPDVLAAEQELASILADLEQFAEAEALLRGILARTQGPMRHMSLGALALVLLVQEKGAEAEPLARECLGIRADMMPEQWGHYSAMSLLGEALLLQGRLDEAEPLLREAAERMPDAQQARRRALPDAYRRLIRLYEAQGRDAEAQLWRTKLEALQQR